MSLLDRILTVRSRVGPPRQLKVTREGVFYGLFTLGVGAAAVNTGNNLLYLVLGLQLFTIIISGVLSEWALTGLELASLGARDGRAGDETSWLLCLRKRAGRIPSYSLELFAPDGPAQGARAGILRLAPGAEQTVELRFTPSRRGRFVARRLVLSTRFPFGLFEKSRELHVAQEIFVYPRRGPTMPPEDFPRVQEGARPTLRAGRGPELLALRAWVPGDGLGQMHWRKSAQAGSWVVATREHEQAPTVELRVDLRAQPDPTDLARLEALLERAAGASEHALDRGLCVKLHLGEARVDGQADKAGRRRVLRALAAAEPELGSRSGRSSPCRWPGGWPRTPRRSRRSAPWPAAARCRRWRAWSSSAAWRSRWPSATGPLPGWASGSPWPWPAPAWCCSCSSPRT